MFGGVATRDIMPLISPAKLRGIISFDGEIFSCALILNTIGMKIATIPVELITEPITATETIRKTRSLVSLPEAFFKIQSPTPCDTPVLTSPSPTTNMRAIRIMLGSLKPRSASGKLTMPKSGSTTSASSATMSRPMESITAAVFRILRV